MGFDTHNWKHHKIALIIIIVLLIILIVYATKKQIKDNRRNPDSTLSADGNGTLYAQGRPNEQDDLRTLLDKIEWSAYLDQRKNNLIQPFLISVVITFFVVIAIIKGVPSPKQLILTVLIAFISIYASHQLFYVHGDIYNDYNIKHGVELVREKLGVEKHRRMPKPRESRIPDRMSVMN